MWIIHYHEKNSGKKFTENAFTPLVVYESINYLGLYEDLIFDYVEEYPENTTGDNHDV